ncbi:MAG: DNA polymerase III subunit delta' [Coriobacteriia bacterium]|nr:DNA polymerase III subunit delta' [Coriobacteriia bacterium]
MANLLSTITGQPKVRDYLRTLVSSGAVSHAYLFCGPTGSGKLAAAYALAQTQVCEQGGCGECDACRRVARHTHPDVHVYRPAGAAGYLVEQVRELVADVSLAPIQAKRKVYVLDQVDQLGTSAANAFLKTLEEPPAGTLLILLARTRESVLPTILSRCQVVPFRHVPAAEAAGIVAQRAGVGADQAAIALQACQGSIDRAVEFCQSSEQRELRQKVLSTLARIRRADDWDLLQAASELTLAAKAPLADMEARMEAQMEENADFLAKSALRQIKDQNKRQLSARAAECLRQVSGVVRSWLRDCMMICAGSPQLVVNKDALGALQDSAAATTEARCAAACACVDRCEQAWACNVSPQTCLEALLIDIRTVLYDPDRSGKPAL